MAVYAINNEPTHAARQLASGKWASKMGYDGVDIEHDAVDNVEGPGYGRAVVVFGEATWVNRNKIRIPITNRLPIPIAGEPSGQLNRSGLSCSLTGRTPPSFSISLPAFSYKQPEPNLKGS